MTESVAIFWDYENCPVPSTASGRIVANNIASLVRPFGSVKLFQAYFEKHGGSKSLELHSELESSGVTLVDCPHNGKKDVADKVIIVDMMTYMADVQPPATIVLITGDRDFSYALLVLKKRSYRVILIAPRIAHTSLKYQASQRFDWVGDVLNPSTSPRWQTRVSAGQPTHRTTLPQNGHESCSDSEDDIDLTDCDQSEDSSPSPSVSSRSVRSLSQRECCYHFFFPLLNILKSHQREGRYRPLRSRVASELMKHVYQNAGVDTFKEYISMAEEAGLVTLGGVGGCAWVFLEP